MLKNMLVLAVAGVMMITCVATAEDPAGEAPKVELPRCPVGGEPVDLSVSVATDDGPVFLCCGKCVGEYEANTAKYADKVREQRVMLDKLPKVQLICPACGEPADKKFSFEKEGVTYHACSADCATKVENDFDTYRKSILNSYTYQAMCPVMGKPINPAIYTTLPTNDNIYFCCKRCVRAFGDNPAKFAPVLERQGFNRLAKRATGSEE